MKSIRRGASSLSGNRQVSSQISESLIRIYRELSRTVDGLHFSAPVAYVYNPLSYAWNSFSDYVYRFARNQKRVVFTGMNPGPWGMVQTGVPFGDISYVRDWLGISAPVAKPPREHPKRIVDGFNCHRGEVSGRRLWQLIKDKFITPRNFFSDQFITNYCPLAFFDTEGHNITPDRLFKEDKNRIMCLCDAALVQVMELLKPMWIIGIGKFVLSRLEDIQPTLSLSNSKIIGILHPSPANPKANKNWDGKVSQQLIDLGVWRPPDNPMYNQ